MLERITGPRKCPNCGNGIKRYSNDKFLECHRCGWKIHLPVIRWITSPTWIIYYLNHPKTFIKSLLKFSVFWIVVTFVVAALTPAGFLSFGAMDAVINGSINQNNISIAVPEINYSTPQEPSQIGSSNNGPGSNPDQNTRDKSQSIDTDQVETLILEKVNERRQTRGMRPLPFNRRAASAARRHAQDMAANSYFSHTSPDGETQRERYSFCRGGENAAKTYYDTQIRRTDGQVVQHQNEEELASGVVYQWMHSRPHRERGIYGEWWNSAGAGVAVDGNDQEVYAVLGFCST